MAIWATALPQLISATQQNASSTTGNTVRRYMPGAPEVYLHKTIDNSRLVREDDPKRARELRVFTCTVAIFFVMCMVYLWQHYSAIEYGYKIEALRSQREAIVDMNKTLKLEEASLKDPERIDTLAHDMGLQRPEVGQVQRLEPAAADSNAPVMARAEGVSVISMPN